MATKKKKEKPVVKQDKPLTNAVYTARERKKAFTK